MKSLANDAAVAQMGRRILRQGCSEELAQFWQIMNTSLVLTDQAVGIFLKMGLQQRGLGQGRTQRDYVPWCGDPVADATQQALKVSNGLEESPNRVQSW